MLNESEIENSDSEKDEEPFPADDDDHDEEFRLTRSAAVRMKQVRVKPMMTSLSSMHIVTMGQVVVGDDL